MKYRNLTKQNNAVVGMITAILIVGLIIMVLTIVNYSYVPRWVENEEASHMESVSNQFAMLKYALDIQSMVNNNTALTTSIKLARDEIQFFEPYRTFGSLTVKTDTCTISIEDNESNYYNFTTDSIEFTSQNTYFVNQNYIMEGGALILSQTESSVMKGQPSIIITEYGHNLTITFINITGVSGRSYASGYGTYPIHTKVTNYPHQYTKITNVRKLTVYTSYPKAWHSIYNDSLKYSGFNYSLDPLDTQDRVVVNFDDVTGDDYTFNIKEVKISAQIAWGLI
jgi:hypothetical protein